jgi:hypothetical protein
MTNANQSTSPTLGVQDVSLDANALDERHSAATVADQQQTLTVSGPAGATVTVMQADTELNLEAVPEYNGSPGYNVEPYEGNNFLNVTYHQVTLDSDGTATVDVTVPDGDAQQAYFMAAIQNDDGSMGAPSNVVVLEHDPTSDQLTLAQAVASANETDDDSAIDLQEIQTAIDWWETDETVPGTDGETINLTEIQQLIDLWASDAAIDAGTEVSSQ